MSVGVNLEEGQEPFIDCFVEHAPLARAVARAGYRTAPAAWTWRTSTSSWTRRWSSTRRWRRISGAPWLIDRARAIEDVEPRWSRSAATRLLASSTTSIRSASPSHERQDPDGGTDPRRARRSGPLDDRELSDRGVGRAGYRDTRRRPPLAGDLDHMRLRRRRSTAAWLDHVERLEWRAQRAQRLPSRLGAPDGGGRRPHRRMLPQSALAQRQELDRRARFRREHAHRGVFVTRTAPHRGRRPVDEATTAQRPRGRGSRGRFREGAIVEVNADKAQMSFASRLAIDEASASRRASRSIRSHAWPGRA